MSNVNIIYVLFPRQDFYLIIYLYVLCVNQKYFFVVLYIFNYIFLNNTLQHQLQNRMK